MSLQKLDDGTYLAPNLLDFAVVHYDKDGTVLKKLDTTVEGDQNRKIDNWPFTAIRTDNGHTRVTCTNGNRVIEFDADGKMVWTLTNADLPGEWLKDPCGAQVLPNGTYFRFLIAMLNFYVGMNSNSASANLSTRTSPSSV